MLSDFYPVLCPFREGKYLVREYLPYGDPFLQDTADFDLDLTIPVGYECAAGTFEQRRERQGTTERRFYTFEGARDLALVCSQKLRYAQTEAGGIPIRYYYESDKNVLRLNKALERMKACFTAYGYEIVDMRGQEYTDNMPFEARFIPDDDIEPGKRIITGMDRLMVRYNGNMIQAPILAVRQNV